MPEDVDEVRELVRALQRRLGRGGVRLSYAQGELALRLIAAGARAVERERLANGGRPRIIRPHELDELLDVDDDPVHDVVELLQRPPLAGDEVFVGVDGSLSNDATAIAAAALDQEVRT